jgi:hypothetical protein
MRRLSTNAVMIPITTPSARTIRRDGVISSTLRRHERRSGTHRDRGCDQHRIALPLHTAHENADTGRHDHAERENERATDNERRDYRENCAYLWDQRHHYEDGASGRDRVPTSYPGQSERAEVLRVGDEGDSAETGGNRRAQAVRGDHPDNVALAARDADDIAHSKREACCLDDGEATIATNMTKTCWRPHSTN